MKTHYHPDCLDWDEVDVGACGVLLGEASNLTADWGLVTCRRCLKGRERIEAGIKADESVIVEQMGDMAKFMRKERPILFNGEMVRAILSGQKTQTRRPLKVQPVKRGHFWEFPWGAGCSGDSLPAIPGHATVAACPLGRVGDRLWVRETWCDVNLSGAPGIAYRADDDVRDLMDNPSFIDEGAFNYDDERVKPYAFAVWSEDLIGGKEGCWRPSIHMPRWACRLVLEITAVRIERLQVISEQDANAEGCDNSSSEAAIAIGWYEKPRAEFRRLWDGIYKSWDENPWVWVIEFEVVEPQ